MGVFARQLIKAHQVFACYGGIVVDRADTSATYKMVYKSKFDLDGAKFRSFGTMINHSLPNAEFRAVTINGVKYVIVRALRDIQANEEICASYGERYYPPQTSSEELRPKAMEQFVREHPLKEFLDLLVRPGDELRENVLISSMGIYHFRHARAISAIGLARIYTS